MNKTSDKIKAARLKAKLSEKQLAKKCGLTANYIEQLESGKKIVSESIAAKIFKALAINPDALTQESMARKEEVVKKRPKPQTVQKVTHTSIDHSASWSGALDNIIRKYPVYNLKTQKPVYSKSLPALEKKIDGYNCDKLSFIEISDNDMSELGVNTEDVIMIYLSTEITNDKIYYFEYQNKKMVRRLRKEQNNKIRISYNHESGDSIIADSNKVKIIGKCVKLERSI